MSGGAEPLERQVILNDFSRAKNSNPDKRSPSRAGKSRPLTRSAAAFLQVFFPPRRPR